MVRKRDTEIVVSVGEFALMDIPAVKPNHCGVFVKNVAVKLPLPQGYSTTIHIAKDSAGKYYYSWYHTWRTGGTGFLPSMNWNSCETKEEAFISALRELDLRNWHQRFAGYVAEARHEYFKNSHRQLSLF